MPIVICYKYLIMHVHIATSTSDRYPSEGIAARTLPFPISWSPPPLVLMIVTFICLQPAQWICVRIVLCTFTKMSLINALDILMKSCRFWS